MKNNAEKAKQILLSSSYSLVICKNDQITTFNSSGIITLLDLISTGVLLRDATVADKVVGKAAALLMVLGHVKEVFARIITGDAINIFLHEGISFTYEEQVPFIQNRDKTGICPMEMICSTISNPQIAKLELMKRMNEITGMSLYQ